MSCTGDTAVDDVEEDMKTVTEHKERLIMINQKKCFSQF